MRPARVCVPAAAEVKPLSIYIYMRKTAGSAALAATVLAALPIQTAVAADTAGGVLRSGALLPVALLIGVVLAALGWRLRKCTTKALADLEQCTRKMADGNLQALVSPETMACRLSGQIGENVNELALNLQEVLLLVWNLSRQDLEVLARAETLAAGGPDSDENRGLRADLAFLRHDLEEMQNIVHQFEFYNVIMQEEKLLAKPEPATSQD
jgi:methyl-accepting chemotaxis protein